MEVEERQVRESSGRRDFWEDKSLPNLSKSSSRTSYVPNTIQSVGLVPLGKAERSRWRTLRPASKVAILVEMVLRKRTVRSGKGCPRKDEQAAEPLEEALELICEEQCDRTHKREGRIWAWRSKFLANRTVSASRSKECSGIKSRWHPLSTGCEGEWWDMRPENEAEVFAQQDFCQLYFWRDMWGCLCGCHNRK